MENAFHGWLISRPQDTDFRSWDLGFGAWNLAAVAGVAFRSAFGEPENIPNGGSYNAIPGLLRKPRLFLFSKVQTSLTFSHRKSLFRSGITLCSGRDSFLGWRREKGPGGGPAEKQNPSEGCAFCRVFSFIRSFEQAQELLKEKTLRTCVRRALLYSGLDGTRTRDPLRDRQVF